MGPDPLPQKRSSELPQASVKEEFDFEYADAISETDEDTLTGSDDKGMTLTLNNKVDASLRESTTPLSTYLKMSRQNVDSNNRKVVKSSRLTQSPFNTTQATVDLLSSTSSEKERTAHNLPFISTDNNRRCNTIYKTENNNRLGSDHLLLNTQAPVESNKDVLGLEKERKNVQTSLDITCTLDAQGDIPSKKTVPAEINKFLSADQNGARDEPQCVSTALSKDNTKTQKAIRSSTFVSGPKCKHTSAAVTSPSTSLIAFKQRPSFLPATDIAEDTSNYGTPANNVTTTLPRSRDPIKSETSPRRESVVSSCSVSSVDIKLSASKTDVDITKNLDVNGLCPTSTSSDAIFDSHKMASSSSQQSDGKRLKASSGQDGGSKEKNSLSMKISKSLGSFFQRSPSSTPLDTSRPLESKDSDQKRVNLSGQSSQNKETKRRSSLAGRLMTSFAEFGRRRPNTHKAKTPSGNDEKQKEENDLDALFNNNKKRVPVFVSPADQMVIVLGEEPDLLTEEQKVIIRESWAFIKTDVADVGVETFMGLFNTHPDAIDSFLAFKDKSVTDIEQSAVLKAHALRVMQTVDKCVSRLDVPDKMASILVQLGRRHVGYQANARLIPMIGKQFVSAIEPKMADKWSRDVKAAWEGLFKIINYNIRKGIQDETKRKKDEQVASGDKKT